MHLKSNLFVVYIWAAQLRCEACCEEVTAINKNRVSLLPHHHLTSPPTPASMCQHANA